MYGAGKNLGPLLYVPKFSYYVCRPLFKRGSKNRYGKFYTSWWEEWVMKGFDFFLPFKTGLVYPGPFRKRKCLLPNACCPKTHERYGIVQLLLFSAYGVVLALIWSTPSLFDRYMKVQASSTRTCSIVIWIMNDDSTGAAGSHNLKLPCTLLSGAVTSSIGSPIGACSNSTSPLADSDFCTIILGSTPAYSSANQVENRWDMVKTTSLPAWWQADDLMPRPWNKHDRTLREDLEQCL